MSEHSGVDQAGVVGPLTATIEPAAAAASRWDVVVVGGGPAGAASAARLAARGVRVLLVDATSMPRPKLCGCCLSATALRELAQLHEGLGVGASAVARRVLPLDRVRLTTATASAIVPLAGGGVISRESLDAAGVACAITCGAAWLPQARVVSITPAERPADPLVVDIACGDAGRHELVAETVVVAAGLADTIRNEPSPAAPSRQQGDSPAGRIGLGTTLSHVDGGPPVGELVMAVTAGGYCGVVRLEDGRLDLAAALDRRAIAAAGSPAAAIARVLNEAGGNRAARLDDGHVAAALTRATFRGTPPLTRALPVADSAGRLLRVGDAAGYVEPFTGEGIGWALLSARLLDEAFAASAASAPASHRAEIAARYASLHARHFAIHHGRCRRVALAVRRPWLVASALRLARLSPALAARVAPLVVGAPSPRKPRA